MARNLETATASAPRAGVVVSQSWLAEAPLFGGGRARRLKRRRRILATTAAALSLLLSAGSAYVLTQRNVTTAVGLNQAVAQFRQEAPAARTPATSNDAGRAPVAKAATSKSSSVKTAEIGTQKTPATRPAAKAILPAEGVYTYRTTGGESISMFGASHKYPSRTYATIRHLGGCTWEHRNEVIAEHVDILTLCTKADSVAQLAQERQVEFFGQRDGAKLDCDPVLVLSKSSDARGASHATRCTDHNGTNALLTATFVGIERTDIGGTAVDAIHVRVDATTSGRVRGTSVDDFWSAPGTGLTVRWERTVDSLANAWGAEIRYRENATFLLESLEPKS
jgi:hypothetical protein